jgi:hypothetical protein
MAKQTKEKGFETASKANAISSPMTESLERGEIMKITKALVYIGIVTQLLCINFFYPQCHTPVGGVGHWLWVGLLQG